MSTSASSKIVGTTSSKCDLLVIGAGLARTGTLSTRAALEHLLGGPCYHGAVPLAERPEHALPWIKVFKSGKLEEAEAGLSRLEAELNGLDSRLEGLEAESTAWCLPPSLDSARAELEELETAMVGLQELQEQVINTKK